MKKILVGLLASGMVLGSVVIASAATFYGCGVPQGMGVSDDLKGFKVTCNQDVSNGKGGWVVFSDASADQQMATVLTAIAADKPVSVSLSGNQNSDGYNIVEFVVITN